MARRFARRATSYDRHADLQRRIADRLAAYLPDLAAPHVLEIGAGTGLLTRHLMARYGPVGGRFLITDIAPEMVAEAKRAFSEEKRASAKAKCAFSEEKRASAEAWGARFAVLDGEAPAPAMAEGPFDLVASSLVMHWFDDPAAGLARLRRLLAPGGELLYSAIGPDFLVEWRAALAAEGVDIPAPATADLPGIFHETRERVGLGKRAGLLNALRGTGALTPACGARGLTPRRLEAAILRFEACHGGRATLHILYGRLRDGRLRAARASSPRPSPA